MMRVLIVDNSCVLEVNQRKWVELAKHKDIEVLILVPRVWISDIDKERYSHQSNSTNPKLVVAGDVFFPGACNRYFFRNNFVKTLQIFHPDIIFVDTEPGNPSVLQFTLLAKLFGAKLLFSAVENNPQGSIPGIKRLARTLMEAIVFRGSECAIALSKDAKNLLRRKGFKKSIKVIPFPTDSDHFHSMHVRDLKEKFGLKDFVIGYLGRLSKEKGLLSLIRAIAKLKKEDANFTLLLVGEGILRHEIEALADELGVREKIRFTGAVPHHDAPRYLNCMDLLVLPSVTMPYWKEQFGRVLIEAMACEIPVLGSNSGEIPNVIEKTGGGLIFKEGDVEELKEKILLLMRDENLRRRLAKRGRVSVTSRFSYVVVTQEIRRVLLSVLSQRKSIGRHGHKKPGEHDRTK
ncbi:MAG TPA: glycosyltransferase family 1 protein [Candidatus Scalindua sp.]|nr:glycosyltransferase family 1 protein [Candidatus Scalindua sp.]